MSQRQYSVTTHAIQRAVERLGIAEVYAANHLRQLMQTAQFIGYKLSGRVFDHYKSGTRLIVSDNDSIITVYKIPVEISLPFEDEVMEFIRRKYKKNLRKLNAKRRGLQLQSAELNVELAQLKLNQLKARSPKVREIIAKKIAEISESISILDAEIKRLCKTETKLTNSVESFCGGN